MNKNNRRVRKTQKALQVALAELMVQKELRQITVQELADRADIHRATFYIHYQDVYDLYEHMEDAIISELSAMIAGEPSHNYDGIYRPVLDYLNSNAAFAKMVFSEYGGCSFRQRITALLEERYLVIWLYEEPDTQITDEMRYLSAYHMNGCISIIERWVRRNFAESVEQISRLLRLVNDGFDRMIG